MATLQCNSGAYTIVGVASKLAFTLSLAVGAYAITGSAATTRHGYQVVNPPGSYTLSGSTLNTNRLAAEPVGYLVTGTAATLTHSGTGTYSISAVSGVYTTTSGTTILEKGVPLQIGSHTLSGTAATLVHGTSGAGFTLVAANGTYGLTGSVAVLELIIPINSGEYLLTGTTATLRRGKRVSAVTTAYNLTGTPATTKRGRIFAAAGTAYTITGSVVNLVYSASTNKVIVANSGTFLVTGTASPLRIRLNPVSGSYSLTGTVAMFRRTIIALPGTYAITGSVVGTRAARLLTVAPGSYMVVAPEAALRGDEARLLADSGSYFLAGLQTVTRPARRIIASVSSYQAIGSATGLRATQIVCVPGNYVIIGTAATLQPSRSGRWRQHPKRPQRMVNRPAQTTTWQDQPNSPSVEII